MGCISHFNALVGSLNPELSSGLLFCRFGELLHLGKDEFLKEVTQASAFNPDAVEEAPKAQQQHRHDEEKEEALGGTWVVLHMYKESVSSCITLNKCFASIASKYRDVKFMKAISTDVIADSPDTKLPTILLYFGGTCKKQVVGAEDWGGSNITMRSIEKTLSRP